MRGRKALGSCVAAVMALTLTTQANAYLYWKAPNFTGAPVQGTEPDIALPLPGANPAEVRANLLWTLRAALNIAALQCQFAPQLMTVSHYNTMLSQHSVELAGAHATLGKYFRRVHGKNWQSALDRHTTKSYNGLSTLKAQLGFCETASHVGLAAIEAPRNQLLPVAERRMREIRNSLVPYVERLVPDQPRISLPIAPSFDERCWNKGALRKECLPPRA